MHEEPVYRITLLRHAESVGNAEERLQGHADYPLSERGRAQAVALAQRWRAEAVTFDHVIASPLSRALETARIIAAELEIPNVVVDPLWIEQDVGTRYGANGVEAEPRHSRRDPAASASSESTLTPAESNQALFLRGGEALRSVLQRSPARYLIASHQAILNMVLYGMLGIDPRPDFQGGTRFRLQNGSFSRFRYYPLARRWQVDVIGDRAHWTGGR